MKDYRVMWGIEVRKAPSPVHAALEALRVQRDPESIATVFVIEDLETGEEVMVDVGDHQSTPSTMEH